MEIEPYADLPDEVLKQVLGRAAEVASGVRTLFTRLDERRESLRAALTLGGHIRLTDDLPTVLPPSVAAVDGGAAIDRALGADTALAVAVGIEGLTESPVTHWPGVQYAAWQRILPHEGEETGATCRGIMASLELAVLRDAPHEVVFLDGSHLTPIIGLNTMLSVRNETLRDEIAEAVAARETAECLLSVMTRPEIVAVVKYDSSRDLTRSWLPPEARGPGIGLDDRTTMTLLLEEGEYTEPMPVALSQQSKSNWVGRQIPTLTPSDAARERVRSAVNDAITLAREDRILATYYKPHVWSPAFRLEIKPEAAKDPARLARVFAAVRSQVVSPEIREPYPQWVADRMARSVGDALVALRAAVNYDLADSGMAEYVSLMAYSYRTEPA